MSEHPFLRAEDIEALRRLLDRDYQHYPHIISRAEVRRWMDADERPALIDTPDPKP